MSGRRRVQIGAIVRGFCLALDSVGKRPLDNFALGVGDF
jgi:hypothetical protein